MTTVKQLLEHYHRMSTDEVMGKRTEIIEREMNRWVEEASNGGAYADQEIEHLRSGQSEMVSGLREFGRHYSQIRRSLLNKIDEIDSDYYERSTQLYREGWRDSAEYIFKRQETNRILTTPRVWEIFLSRIGHHVNWQWPALEFRPGHNVLSRHLVGCDPLYLVDTSDQLLVPSRSGWTEEYCRRVRHYTVNETDQQILGGLPQGQFGLVAAVDFFQYRPIELIERYAAEVFGLLRPGGVFFFAYNNCDLPNGVDLADNMFYCYTPGRKVEQILKQNGYEILAVVNPDLNTSWIEARKPGTLSSIRGSQTLGKVVNI